MPLKNKYLKYSPEITLEIFGFVWDKLIKCGYKFEHDKNEIYKRLQFAPERYLRSGSDGTNTVYPFTSKIGYNETTVQEILGYDPFVKEEVVPEYVEYIKKDAQLLPGIIYKIQLEKGFSFDRYNDVYYINNMPYFQSFFKPSTKESFDAQNRPIVEKWSVGSYFVIEKDSLYNISSSKRGDICVIKEDKTFNFINKKDQTNWSFDFRDGSKWFATKSEAEEFAKTLVESIQQFKATECKEFNGTGKVMVAKLYPNGHTEVNEECPICKGDGFIEQESKRAVHCRTQEEWDFVLSKFNENDLDKFNWNTYKAESCLAIYKDLNRGGYTSVDHFKLDEIEIISFQEWCNLNNYKMETKKGLPFNVGDKFRVKFKPDVWSSKLGGKCPLGLKFPAENLEVVAMDFDSSGRAVIFDGTYGWAYSPEIFEKMETKCEFEAGKWYKCKCNKNLYKCNGYSDTKFHVSEAINPTEKPIAGVNPGWDVYDRKDACKEYFHPNELASIKEIQKYLPDGHPDKIQLNPEFKVGDWVIVIESKSKFTYFKRAIGYVFQIRGDGNYYKNFINGSDEAIDASAKYCINYNKSNIRLATPEEINNYLISSGQIPAGDIINRGIEPDRDCVLRYTTAVQALFNGNYSNSSNKPQEILTKSEVKLNYLPEPE